MIVALLAVWLVGSFAIATLGAFGSMIEGGPAKWKGPLVFYGGWLVIGCTWPLFLLGTVLILVAGAILYPFTSSGRWLKEGS